MTINFTQSHIHISLVGWPFSIGSLPTWRCLFNSHGSPSGPIIELVLVARSSCALAWKVYVWDTI